MTLSQKLKHFFDADKVRHYDTTELKPVCREQDKKLRRSRIKNIPPGKIARPGTVRTPPWPKSRPSPAEWFLAKLLKTREKMTLTPSPISEYCCFVFVYAIIRAQGIVFSRYSLSEAIIELTRYSRRHSN